MTAYALAMSCGHAGPRTYKSQCNVSMIMYIRTWCAVQVFLPRNAHAAVVWVQCWGYGEAMGY